jgi:hypothetical protein
LEKINKTINHRNPFEMVVTIINTTASEPAIPQYSELPLHSPVMKMHISNGSFVMMNGDSVQDTIVKTREGQIVVQLTSYDTSRNVIEGNLLVLLSHVLDVVGVSLDTEGTEVRRIYDGIASGFVELVKTPNRVIATINDIIDVCFVFDLENIEDGRAFGLGISNCYLCRYYYLPDNQQIEPFKLEERFASDNPQHTSTRRCTSSILWYSICALQDVIWRSLNRYGERQENWSKVKCNMNDILWDYLIHRTNGLVHEITAKSPVTRHYKKYYIKGNRTS